MKNYLTMGETNSITEKNEFLGIANIEFKYKNLIKYSEIKYSNELEDYLFAELDKRMQDEFVRYYKTEEFKAEVNNKIDYYVNDKQDLEDLECFLSVNLFNIHKNKNLFIDTYNYVCFLAEEDELFRDLSYKMINIMNYEN